MSDTQYEEPKKGLFYYSIVIVYVLLVAFAFLVSTERKAIIPLFPTVIRHFCDAGVILLSVLYYLVTAIKKRIHAAIDLAWLWSIPYIGIAMISLFIWILSMTDSTYILRGLKSVCSAELTALAVACAIWTFGKRVVDYTFYGAVIAVALVVIQVILDYGIAEFNQQYLTLLITFTGKTGPAMKYLELHDLAQGLGIFLMYYTWTLKKNLRNVLLFLASFICFSLSLKRIVVIALIAGLLIGWCLNKLSFKKRWYYLIAFEVALFLGAYAYLFLIKQGYYGTVMNWLGINTMSRDAIYTYYADFFELSPDYLGRGLRFIYMHTSETTEVIKTSNNAVISVHNAHNEYITYFIELGFFGFIFWLWSNSWIKLNGIRRRYGWEAMTFTMIVVAYCFVTYLTDNTYFYYSINYVGFITSGMAVISSRKAEVYEQNVGIRWLRRDELSERRE